MHQCMLDHAKPGLMSLGDDEKFSPPPKKKRRPFFMIGRFGGVNPQNKTKKQKKNNLNMDTEKSHPPFLSEDFCLFFQKRIFIANLSQVGLVVFVARFPFAVGLFLLATRSIPKTELQHLHPRKGPKVVTGKVPNGTSTGPYLIVHEKKKHGKKTGINGNVLWEVFMGGWLEVPFVGGPWNCPKILPWQYTPRNNKKMCENGRSTQLPLGNPSNRSYKLINPIYRGENISMKIRIPENFSGGDELIPKTHILLSASQFKGVICIGENQTKSKNNRIPSEFQVFFNHALLY